MRTEGYCKFISEMNKNSEFFKDMLIFNEWPSWDPDQRRDPEHLKPHPLPPPPSSSSPLEPSTIFEKEEEAAAKALVEKRVHARAALVPAKSVVSSLKPPESEMSEESRELNEPLLRTQYEASQSIPPLLRSSTSGQQVADEEVSVGYSPLIGGRKKKRRKTKRRKTKMRKTKRRKTKKRKTRKKTHKRRKNINR